MTMRFKPVEVTPSMGGALVARPRAGSSGGIANWVEKVNMRRVVDAEQRREGWVPFAPVNVVPGDQPLGIAGAYPVAQFARPNGSAALVAAAPGALWRFFPLGGYRYVEEGYWADGYVNEFDKDDYRWIQIAGALALEGEGAKRWQAESVNGYLVLNNGVDLPLLYREEWTSARPMHELREQGIARVGRIVRYGTYLFFMDLTEITDESLDAWFANAADPYGRVTPELALAAGADLVRTHYAVQWSHPGEPGRHAVMLGGDNLAGSNVFTMRFAARSFQPDQEVVIVGGGVDGGNLVTRISQIAGDGRTVRLAANTSSAGTALMRADMVGSPVGRYDLQDNSARILSAREFRGRLVIFTDSTYFTVTVTGEADDPFRFDKYWDPGQDEQGRVPHFANTLLEVGDALMYVSYSGPWQIDLRTPAPRSVSALALGVNFWRELVEGSEERVFAFDNTLTHEIWFCTPGRTVCYGYEPGVSVSVVDAVVTGGLVCRRPVINFGEPAELWCVLSLADGVLRRYGLGQRFVCHHRDGAAYTSVLASGLGAFGVAFHEKELRSYLLGHEHVLGVFCEGDDAGQSLVAPILPLPGLSGFVVEPESVEVDSVRPQWRATLGGLVAGLWYRVTATRRRYTRTPCGEEVLESTVHGHELAAFCPMAEEGALAMHAAVGPLGVPPAGRHDRYSNAAVALGVVPAGTVTVSLRRADAPYQAPVAIGSMALPDPDTGNMIPVQEQALYFSDRVVVAGVANAFRLAHRTWEVGVVGNTAGVSQVRAV